MKSTKPPRKKRRATAKPKKKTSRSTKRPRDLSGLYRELQWLRDLVAYFEREQQKLERD
jgi:hypothetical protein